MKKLKISDVILNNFIQFIFIFSSVYFAVWLTNYREAKEIEKIEKKAVESLYKELQENLIQLDKAEKFHKEIRDRLFSYTDSIEKKLIVANSLKPKDHLSKIFTRRSNSLGMPHLNRDSWEMLQRSEAYITLDYELASNLGKLYRLQKSGVELTIQKIGSELFNTQSQFKKEESEALIFLTAWSFREIAGQEQYLIRATKESLNKLEEHYPFLKIKN
ncbi:hypothetical protein JKA74_02335 [Marivirga sp. S37H4]|uniref:Uncharacterized protein n=1 Tax=Marivirga aurantiaca TaxID=2802615 RepID=A0A935C5H8_9BACT|nr:hypothetical protein [Marivirga aurantiaca]MBK6263861.1 hypothetical protein [Marivirga aurantiaca]